MSAADHIEDGGGHIKVLDGHVRELKAALQSLPSEDDLDLLLSIIHRQGWTTLIDVVLVEGLVQSATQTAQALATAWDATIKGSELIAAVEVA